MGMNKKGVLFSIISLLIATLIITIFTIEIQNDFETEVSLLSARTESFESTFDIIQLNIDNMLETTGYDALKKLTEASSILYDKTGQQSYDMDLQCEFEKLMRGENISVYNSTPVISSIFNEEVDLGGAVIPGVYEGDPLRQGLTCDSAFIDFVNITNSVNKHYLQEFIADGQLLSDEIQLAHTMVHTNLGAIMQIKILDECHNILAEYNDRVISTGAFSSCGDRNIYTLDKPVLYEKGKTYYIEISTTANNMWIETWQNDYTGITEGSLTTQDQGNITMNNANYGYDPSISPTLTDFLDDVEVFMEDTYNIDMNYSVERIELLQNDPWSIEISGDIKVSFYDGSITLNKLVPFNKKLSLEGLPDPMFAKYREDRDIVRAIPKVEAELVFEDLMNLTDTSEYIKDGNSPRYIDRFSSDLKTSRCCGLFSTIERNDWIGTPGGHEHDIDVFSYDYSMVDWHFLSEKDFCTPDTPGLGEVSHSGPIPSPFFMDERTLAKFNITNSTPEVLEIVDACP